MLSLSCCQFYWEDELGEVHDILQGEGGEQGDPLTPALFALGQHEALEAICRVLLPSEKLFAFLDDIFIVGAPERMAFLHAQVESALWDPSANPYQSGEDAIVEPCRCVLRWLRAYRGCREESRSPGNRVDG